MAVGDSVKLVAEVKLPDGTYNGNVTWSSADDTIATINPTNGTVVALQEGRVSIVAAYAPDPTARGLATLTIGDTLPPVEAPPMVVVLPSPNVSSAAQPEPASGPSGSLVSLNLKSKVYHLPSCRYYGCSNCSMVPLGAAQSRGRPCQICH
jgi:hypothetical protein